MKQLGVHLIIEAWGCDIGLNSYDTIKKFLVESTQATNSTLIKLEVHEFEPYGYSGIAILAESHISIHTWPEHKYAAIDIFTCGTHTQPENAINVVKRFFKPKNVQITKVFRGVIDDKKEKE